jgi:ATP-dependent helicase HrpB
VNEPLPIDAHLPEIVRTVRGRRALVLVAPPGAGKTTRVPPSLAVDGPVIVLQPRRVAARAIARRIAREQGWTVGGEVGWQVRFERQFGPGTRLLVATEGILTARLQSDPLLADFRTIVLDEFHERSMHADLALALARQAMAARDDLRLVVMSATIDAGPVAAFLGGCPVLEVPGRPFPVEIAHAPGLTPADAVRGALARPGGHVLCFLPGAPEIRRAASALADAGIGGRHRTTGAGPGDGVADRSPIVLPLHGSLDAEAQEAALAPSRSRKVILATNIAETSLTIDGVTDVIDTGLHKVLRHDPAIGIDRLETERIPRDSADQRAGRAGRTGPGRALRLWDEREILRPHREPEIIRADLAGPLLDLLAWGGDPRVFQWFEPPPSDRVDAALALLEMLGAAHAGRITERGRALRRFPLHPRLARLLLATGEAGGRPAAGRHRPANRGRAAESGSLEAVAAACAVLSEGWVPSAGDAPAPTTDSDLWLRADRLGEAPPRVRRAASELLGLARRVMGEGGGAAVRPAGRDAGRAAASAGDETLRRAALAAYPDRVGRRREPGSPRFVLASGHGAVLGRESGVREGEFIVALDVTGGARGAGSEALIRMASRIEREWIDPTGRVVAHRFDAGSGTVRAVERAHYLDLVLSETPVAPDPEIAGEVLAAALLERGLAEDDLAFLRRLRFAGQNADAALLVRQACAGRATLPATLDLGAHLPHAARRDLDRLAPETLPLPSGRRARLEYRDDGSVVAAVKLQEMFGLAETPRLGPRREPVIFALLSPAGRPVQTTRDLRSFWRNTYPEVRKELRARYPKHPWPEDPWTATPTHRTTRRPGR